MIAESIRHAYHQSVADIRNTKDDPNGPNLQQVDLSGYFAQASIGLIEKLETRIIDRNIIGNSLATHILFFTDPFGHVVYQPSPLFEDLDEIELRPLFQDLVRLRDELRPNIGKCDLSVKLATEFVPRNYDLHYDGSTQATILLKSSPEANEHAGTVFVGPKTVDEPIVYGLGTRVDHFLSCETRRQKLDVYESGPFVLNVFNGRDSCAPVTHAAPSNASSRFLRPRLIAVYG